MLSGFLARVSHRNSRTEPFQRQPLEISDFHCPVSHIVCETNKHWISEMLSNRHTDPTTVPSLHMHAEGNGFSIGSVCTVCTW